MSQQQQANSSSDVIDSQQHRRSRSWNMKPTQIIQVAAVSPLRRRWRRNKASATNSSSGSANKDQWMIRKCFSEDACDKSQDTAVTSHSNSTAASATTSQEDYFPPVPTLHRRCSSANDAAMAVAAACHEEEEQEVPTYKRSDLYVGKLLGEGGFAQVFEVKIKKSALAKKHKHPLHLPNFLHTSTTTTTTAKRKLALKQLRPQLLAEDPQLFQRAAHALVQEASIMTKLQGHDHILTLRGVSGDASTLVSNNKKGFDAFVLITDQLQETMAQRLETWSKTPATPKRLEAKLQYAMQLAQALSYCHEHRIIYRDCKVDNIGFSDNDTVQLFDFGLARALPATDNNGKETSSNNDAFHMTICGTQRYMAPEVYNEGVYGVKADVYSWAMTTLHILTGKKPHSYMSLPVHAALILEGGGRPSLEGRGLPLPVNTILTKAWEHSPGQRWSMAQVAAALGAYLAGGGVDDFDSICQQLLLGEVKPLPTTLLHDQSQTNNMAAVMQASSPTSLDTTLPKNAMASAA